MHVNRFCMGVSNPKKILKDHVSLVACITIVIFSSPTKKNEKTRLLFSLSFTLLSLSFLSLHTDTSIRTFDKMLFNALLSTAKRVGTCSFSTSSRFALLLFLYFCFSSQPTIYFKNARTMTLTMVVGVKKVKKKSEHRKRVLNIP